MQHMACPSQAHLFTKSASSLTPSKSRELRLGLQTSGRGLIGEEISRSLGAASRFLSPLSCRVLDTHCPMTLTKKLLAGGNWGSSCPRVCLATPRAQRINSSAHLRLFLSTIWRTGVFVRASPKPHPSARDPVLKGHRAPAP